MHFPLRKNSDKIFCLHITVDIDGYGISDM